MPKKHCFFCIYYRPKVNFQRKRKAALWLHKPKSIKKTRLICTPSTSSHARITEDTKTPGNCDESVKPSCDDLIKAPEKLKQTKNHINGKKSLFKATLKEDMVKEIIDLMPVVLQKIDEAGVLFDFCNFLRMICNGKFPLKNIAFLLLLDVVRWYSLNKTSEMTYSEDTMKFWKVIYRIFHGKLLRFMSDSKSTGDGKDNRAKGGCLDPQQHRLILHF